MALLERDLNGAIEGNACRMVYDTDAKEIFIDCHSEARKTRFSINEFLAQEFRANARQTLEGMIIDMFPNIPEDLEE